MATVRTEKEIVEQTNEPMATSTGPHRCCSPSCPGRWYKASEMAHPCPPKRVPFSVLRRAYEMLDVTVVPSVRWLERNGSASDRSYARNVRADFAQAVAEEM